MVCFCCSDCNEVSNEELSAAQRDQRPRDSVETQRVHARTHTHTPKHTYTHTHPKDIQTHPHCDAEAITTHRQLLPLTHGHGPETFLPCVDEAVMWSPSTNRQEAEFLKTAEPGRHDAADSRFIRVIAV